MEGFRSEKRRFTADTMVVAIMPITHALQTCQYPFVSSFLLNLAYSNCVRRHVLIVVANGCSYFKVRRIFFEQGMFEIGLLFDVVGFGDPVGGILSPC